MCGASTKVNAQFGFDRPDAVVVDWGARLVGMVQHDVSWLMVSNLLLAGLGFASGIMLARILQPVGRGEFAAAILWPTLLVNLGGLGLPQAVVYQAGRRRADLGPVVATALVLGTWVGLLLCCLGWFMILPLALQAQRPLVLAAARLNLALTTLGMGIILQGFILQGIGQLKLWSALRVGQSVLYVLALVGLALSHKANVLNIMRAISLTTLLPGLMAFIVLLPRFNKVMSFELKLAKEITVYGLKNLLAGIAGMVNLRLDQAVMTLWVEPRQLGLYAVAVALAQGLQPVSASFANFAFPRVTHMDDLAEARRVIRRLFQANLVVSAALALPLALFAPSILALLFGAAYTDAGVSASILIIAAIFFGTNYVLSDSLRGLNAPLGPALAEGGSTIVTGIGLYALLPRLGIVGAAWTSLLSYLASTLILIWVMWTRFGLSPGTLFQTVPEDSILLKQIWNALSSRWLSLQHKVGVK